MGSKTFKTDTSSIASGSAPRSDEESRKTNKTKIRRVDTLLFADYIFCFYLYLFLCVDVFFFVLKNREDEKKRREPRWTADKRKVWGLRDGGCLSTL